MSIEEDVRRLIRQRKVIRSSDVSEVFGVSRQYAHRILREYVRRGDLIKVGGTRGARYVLPGVNIAGRRFKKRFNNRNTDESAILSEIEKKNRILFDGLSENVRHIFQYSFLEMVNNAIEHSHSKTITICIERDQDIVFSVNDVGIGAFASIRRKKRLLTELDAIQDLLKGKTTTQPVSHSGEGIFFTSKAVDTFSIESHRTRLIIDNVVDDVFLEALSRLKKGTRVQCRISNTSTKDLTSIFEAYQTDPSTVAFDKTAVRIKLFVMGGDYLSRSHARRVLAGLERFRSVTFDFDRVSAIGQAFADEIFRVFHSRHPHVRLQTENMNSAVRFMVERAKHST